MACGALQQPLRFGWQAQGALSGRPDWDAASFSLERYLDGPPGYRPNRFYGVCDLPAGQRGMGKTTGAALAYLYTVLAADPFEMNNLAQDPAHARRIQALTRQM